MRITRRRFLQGAAAATASLALPGWRRFPGRPGLAWASGPTDAILVAIRLYGGNDGLNTVIPVNGSNRSLYTTGRPVLGIPTGDLSSTEVGVDFAGDTYALHPDAVGLKALFDAGKLAIIPGVGYPNQNLSHFASEAIWYRADPVGAGATGWLGGYLDTLGLPAADVPAIDVEGGYLTPLLRTAGSSVLAIGDLPSFTFPIDYGYSPDDDAAKQGAFDDIYQELAGAPPPLDRIAAVGYATSLKTAAYPHDTVDAPLLDAISGNLGQDLKVVLTLIQADVGARIFHVGIDGFDTHSNQGTSGGFHGALLSRVGAAMQAFLDSLDSTTRAKTIIWTFSEFGRRIEENGYGGSAGTDHGSVSPMFVAGDAVAEAKIWGGYPDLANQDNDGNFKFEMTGTGEGRTIDFRDYFGTILKWLGIADPTTLLAATGGWSTFTDLGFLG
jgi:uncharacterized protein (DUF1501 family)